MDDIRIEMIFDEENMQKALESLKKKGDSSGIDGVRLADIEEYWNCNRKKIITEINKEIYKPGVIQQKVVLARNGKERMVYKLISIDRLILRAMAQVLSSELDGKFSVNSYAYREHKGTLAAAEKAAAFMEQGRIWCAELDVEKFFDNIPHADMMKKIKTVINDPRILKLIAMFMSCTIEESYTLKQKKIGLVQGNSLSPFLSNLYLNDFDSYLEELGAVFCRFGDNINIYCESYENALQMFDLASTFLQEKECLKINQEKSGVFNGLKRRYLGFQFEKRNKAVLFKRVRRANSGVYYNWHTTGIQKIDKNYHLINDGVITRRDFTLLFENEEKKRYIPVETMDALYIHSNITFSSSFFEFINRRGLNVTLIDKYGNKIGSFVPQNNRRSIKTELAQIKFYEDEKQRLAVAKKLELACLISLRSNIRYYIQRKEEVILKNISESLSLFITEINGCENINRLMLVEAQARQKYYQAFDIIMGQEGFQFEKRTRRPPKNPLNAMLSFGNTLIYQRFANEINRTSLDVRFGIIHAAGRRAESLNLDLADLFKPILVDRTIFTLVNRKMLDLDKDFEEVENNGVYLSKHGKRIFIEEFERKLYQKIKIGGEMRTYDALMRLEVQKVRRFIENKEDYKPYKYVN